MSPSRTVLVVMAVSCLPAGFAARAADAQLEARVRDRLNERVIDPQLPLAEIRAYIKDRIPTVPHPASLDAWNDYANKLREDVLERAVLRGAAAAWQKAHCGVQWLGTIEGGEGYQIKKLRYEALPGLWIPALLYVPNELTTRVPVVLNVNGHDPVGKAAPYKQIRCINLAKRGMLALNTEWLGMGQLKSDNFLHYRMNQIDLCGTSGLAPFFLALERAIDVLLSHEHADPERLAVTGLSGGGWQTMLISGLDPRVTLSNAVAGYGSMRTTVDFGDLGDSEQAPADLAMVADHAHLTALRAPRPTLLTYNAADECCFKAGETLPALIAAARPIFQLHGCPEHLRWHVNYDPGTHNYERDNREAFYRMLHDHFYAKSASFDPVEIPCESEVKTPEQLQVELPPENADFHSLAVALVKDLPPAESLPGDATAAREWQMRGRTRLRELVVWKSYEVAAERVADDMAADLQSNAWRLRFTSAHDPSHPGLTPNGEEGLAKRLRGSCLTLSAAEFAPTERTSEAIVIADEGVASAAPHIARLIAAGARVIAFDPLFFGRSAITGADPSFLFALLLSATGERPLGLQASQVAAVANWARGDNANLSPSTLVAIGPRSSTIALVAAALDREAIGALELHRPLGSLHQLIEENRSVEQSPELFCFGLLAEFDLRHIGALVAPRPIRLVDPTPRAQAEFDELRSWYGTLGLELSVSP